MAEEKTLIEILDGSPDSPGIDPSRYVDFVRDPSCGAIATFEGTTRNTFEGKPVLELRYEAYAPMAERRLRAICSAARSEWDLHAVAVAHRLGRVAVGEASVFVAASAPHRADALEACGYLIDEIKASVPIWKKEVYANGEVWKENKEFLERRSSPLGFGGSPAVSDHHRNNGGGGCCCGHKVRVEEEEEEAIVAVDRGSTPPS